eukprot:1161140-Pelagomonas_calceolata.AAC.11
MAPTWVHLVLPWMTRVRPEQMRKRGLGGRLEPARWDLILRRFPGKGTEGPASTKLPQSWPNQ